MNEMQATTLLTREDILLVHSIVIDETGGTHGVRDMHAVLTLEALPLQSAFGRALYPELFDKASLYVRNIIMSHPFVDGNKRTAMVCAGVFLEQNGYTLNVQEGEVEQFAMHVVKEKPELAEIAAWFKAHTAANRRTAKKRMIRKRAPGKKRTS